MNDHEREAMEAAIKTNKGIFAHTLTRDAFAAMWQAGRRYEPPAIEAKEERQPRCLVCDRTKYGHESPYSYTQKHGHRFVAAPSEAR